MIALLAFLFISRYILPVGSDSVNLQGRIVMKMLNDEKSELALIDPKDGTTEFYGVSIGAPVFSKEANKIYSLGRSDLYEHNLSTGDKSVICELNGYSDNYDGYWMNPQYNSVANIISFVNMYDQSLYVFDIGNNSFERISDVSLANSPMHSITSDGERILYANNDLRIMSIDLNTREQTFLCDGINPVLSKDDSLLAYRIVPNSDMLHIKNLLHNEIWELKIPSKTISYYGFSPDGKYLAVMYGDGELENIKLSVFDCYSGKLVKTLVKHFTIGYSNSFDWK